MKAVIYKIRVFSVKIVNRLVNIKSHHALVHGYQSVQKVRC